MFNLFRKKLRSSKPRKRRRRGEMKCYSIFLFLPRNDSTKYTHSDYAFAFICSDDYYRFLRKTFGLYHNRWVHFTSENAICPIRVSREKTTYFIAHSNKFDCRYNFSVIFKLFPFVKRVTAAAVIKIWIFEKVWHPFVDATSINIHDFFWLVQFATDLARV